ncbi:MAG: Mrp/NBP35 family ATP-binding protein [Oscillospiraceae bacterium]|nr:Mrp/NBP35 family ATP-binding protein [Oscillospiraceae bacterium]
MSGCNGNCGACGGCSQMPFLDEEQEINPDVKKVYAVISGKGGVGKSMVSSMMAVAMQRKGYKTAILDADMTGPSIPKSFGISEKVKGGMYGIEPAVSEKGTKVMSVNLLLENETDPVLWRGPIIADAVDQFWSNVHWGEVDFMFVDMPPGTGDVALTVFTTIPVDGIIIVTSPQELVSMIVSKAAKMADIMKIPIVGIVENMSGFVCPDCGKTHKIFGDSHIDQIASTFGIEKVFHMPIDPKLAELCDNGSIENFEGDWLDDLETLL